MDPANRKARMNMEDDRLSMLPDDLIHKILSSFDIKHVVQTSVLSSRWRFIWNSMPYLNISTNEFYEFSQSASHVLSHRSNQIELYSVKLTYHQTISDELLKRFLNYAFSHNLQQLTVTCPKAVRMIDKKNDFPLYLFHSRSLTYLRFTGFVIRSHVPYVDLPTLTTLHLDYVSFYDDSIFSKCANLKNLTLNSFRVMESNSFTLCHHNISNLTLVKGYWTPEAVNVVAPQLKNLAIKSGKYEEHLINITAPNLSSLIFDSSCLLKFSTDLICLENVDICITSTYEWSGCRIVALLQQLHNVSFLRLNLEFVKPLIAYMEGVSLLPSPFSNLKSLKIYPVYIPFDFEAHKKVNMSAKVLNYFLDGSPSAIFTLISYEEIKEKQRKDRAIANAVKAQKLMADLKVMLKELKADFETNRTRMTTITRHEENSTDEDENDTDDQDKARVEKVQLQFKREMTQMKRCWEDIGVRVNQGKRNFRFVISQLREIEVLLRKDIPTSKRDELQECYSSLSAEIDTFVKNFLHHMMIPQNPLSDCLNELAATSMLPS